MARKDDALFLDMLLACQKIMEFTNGLTQNDFESRAIVQSAVIREFQP